MEADEVIRSLQSQPKEYAVHHRPGGGTTNVFQW